MTFWFGSSDWKHQIFFGDHLTFSGVLLSFMSSDWNLLWWFPQLQYRMTFFQEVASISKKCWVVSQDEHFWTYSKRNSNIEDKQAYCSLDVRKFRPNWSNHNFKIVRIYERHFTYAFCMSTVCHLSWNGGHFDHAFFILILCFKHTAFTIFERSTVQLDLTFDC